MLCFSQKSFCLTRTKSPDSNFGHLMPLSYPLLCLLMSFRLVSHVTLYAHLNDSIIYPHISQYSQTPCLQMYSKGTSGLILMTVKHMKIGIETSCSTSCTVICMHKSSYLVFPVQSPFSGYVPSTLISVQLHLSHWPFICG